MIILELWFGNWRKGQTRETATQQNHDFLNKKFEVTVSRVGYFFEGLNLLISTVPYFLCMR
jgi:hypothetical protein